MQPTGSPDRPNLDTLNVNWEEFVRALLSKDPSGAKLDFFTPALPAEQEKLRNPLLQKGK